MDLHELHHQH